MNRKKRGQTDRQAGFQEHLEFERLLADLSARFVNIPADQVDSVIDYGLRKILEFFQVDRVGLLRSLPDRPAYQITHGVYGEDVPSVSVGVELPISFHPWAFEKLAEKREVVSFSRLDDLPPEAYVDRQAYTEWGIRSALDIPIITGGSSVHVIAINSVKSERVWPEELFPRLQLLGEIFVNALERRNAEQSLLEGKERLNLAVTSADAHLWDLDLDTKMMWSTEKGRDFYRLAPGEKLPFMSLLDLVHLEDRERVRESFEKAISGENLDIEYRVAVTPGNFRWINSKGRLTVDSSGNMCRLMGVSIDVTKRKVAELKLSDSRTLLSSLVDSTSDLIWSVDSERFGLLKFNRGLYEYFLNQRGIRIEAGMRPEDLFPSEEFVQKWRDFYRQALERGSFTTEYLVYAGTRTLLLNLNRLEREGDAFGVSVFGKDITESKAMEARLREQLGEIEQLKLQLEQENIYLREELGRELGFGNIIGKSETLKYVLFRVGQVAPTDAAVLILGETGTGKGMVANAIHERSPRRDKSMITVNCAALPANLIESELFGREKGAFTGAHARQAGRFEVANGGTIFLDEIGELPLELQAKLLRVLQEGEFERLGSAKTVKVDVRVIASTSRDLKHEVRAGRFREDLFYRLNVFPITIPPLRDRADDIPELVRFFVEKYSKKFGRHIEKIPKVLMNEMIRYAWPGNVRELEHVIERSVITSPGSVLHFAEQLEPLRVAESADIPMKGMAAMEKAHIIRILHETKWRIEGEKGAAKILKLHPNTLRSRMKKMGIKRP